MLVAAVFVDIRFLKYSFWESGSLGRIDVKPVVLFFGAVAMNLAGSIFGQALHVKLFGFNFSLELCSAAVMHFVWNVQNVRWNLTAKSVAYDIYSKKMKVSLSYHMWWSLFLSNVGNAFRCYARVLLFCVTEASFVDSFPASTPNSFVGWPTYVFFVITMLIIIPFHLSGQFYFAHRLLHSSPTLYVLVHKVHHLSRYPIPSDAGTESPIEFATYYLNFSTTFAPLPAFFIFIWFGYMGEVRKNHDFPSDVENSHILHHIVNAGSFGNSCLFDLDKMLRTEIDPNSSSIQKLKAQVHAVEIEESVH